MRDIWIRKSWLKLATGLIALAIIAAIWINWRWGTGRDAAPAPRPALEGASGRLGITPPGGVVHRAMEPLHASHNAVEH